MVERKDWKEFKNSGLLWWINSLLHTFGWAIVFAKDKDSGEIVDVYPARVKYRGFSEDINTEGYKKVAAYLRENSSDLHKEAKE